MTLESLSEVLKGMVISGIDKNTPVFVPKEANETIEHIEAEVILVEIPFDENETSMAIILYPFDADYYNIEKEEDEEEYEN